MIADGFGDPGREPMKTTIIACAAVLGLGLGQGAYAAAGALWQARNGSATVRATEWFAAVPARRLALSHQYPDQPPSHEYAAQTPSPSDG